MAERNKGKPLNIADEIAQHALMLQMMHSVAYRDGDENGESARKLRRLIHRLQVVVEQAGELSSVTSGALRAAIEEARR